MSQHGPENRSRRNPDDDRFDRDDDNGTPDTGQCCRKTFAWEPNAYGGNSYVCRHAETCPVAGVVR